MTPQERKFWLTAQLRASRLQPELQAAILRAFEIIRAQIPPAVLARIIEAGDVETLFRQALSEAVLEQAFRPVRDRIRSSVNTAIKYVSRDLPKLAPFVPQSRNVAIAFDILNPKVLDAIRTMETRVIEGLKEDVRSVVRLAVSDGVQRGVGPRTIAREIRSAIGLGPTQEQQVLNFRDALAHAHEANPPRSVETYTLRDKRFERTVAKARESGQPIPAEKVDQMVEAYRKRRIAQNAETNARTATLDAYKLGQRLTWQEAIDRGDVDPSRLLRRWTGVMDARERPEHVAMEGETVPFDQPYSNGELVPGESTYGCRCLDRWVVT